MLKLTLLLNAEGYISIRMVLPKAGQNMYGRKRRIADVWISHNAQTIYDMEDAAMLSQLLLRRLFWT